MKPFNSPYFLVVLILVLLNASCSEKDSIVDSNSYSRISILLTNENGEPIQGAKITTYPQTTTVFTDAEGTAVIENVYPRSYSIIVDKSGYPQFNKYVKLEDVDSCDIHFVIFSKVEILLKDEFGRLIDGTKIRTNPATQTVTTDEEGKAVLENMPERAYQFTIERPDLPPVIQNIVLDGDDDGNIEIIVMSENPVITIIQPENNQVFNTVEIIFEGIGTDNEDGELPDDSLVWSSNLDGELGTGKTITVTDISVGNHIIYLKGTDSDDKETIEKISLIIVDYNPDSYFPILENTTWEYRHTEPNFIVVNINNVNELWELENLNVTIDDNKRRISIIYYDITIGTVTKHFRFTLIDTFEEEDDNLYVTNTTEELIEWSSGADENKPYLTIIVETEYMPKYLILNNMINPTAEKSVETSVMAETEWKTIYFNSISNLYHESYNLNTTIQAGDTKHIQTDKGFYKAVEIIFTTEDSSKSWWLARGVGLVRVDYTISDYEQTAVLVDSDLLMYYRGEKPALPSAKASVSHSQPMRTFRISRKPGKVSWNCAISSNR